MNTKKQLTDVEIKIDWLETVEKQIVSAEYKKMINTLKQNITRTLTISDKEIITIHAAVSNMTNIFKNRNEIFPPDKLSNMFVNILFMYQDNSFDIFINNSKETIEAIKKYGLNKGLKHIKTFDNPDYIGEFYLYNSEQHYLLVYSDFKKFIDVKQKSILFGGGYKDINTLNFSDFVFFINAIFDYTGDSVQEVIQKYTNIPFGAVQQANLKIDDFGLKHIYNYFVYGLTHTTNYDYYRVARIEEIKNRNRNPYKPKQLPYPWGKQL